MSEAWVVAVQPYLEKAISSSSSSDPRLDCVELFLDKQGAKIKARRTNRELSSGHAFKAWRVLVEFQEESPGSKETPDVNTPQCT